MVYDIVTILGPTAVGKTQIAVNLSSEFNGEIISADSRQVYRNMDIGTGKDLDEYENYGVSYHLINIVDPSDEYNLYRFYNDFKNAINKIKSRDKIPFLVGGTGMYLSSILQNYNLSKINIPQADVDLLNTLNENELRIMLLALNPKLHNTTDLIDKERIINAILVEKSKKKSEAKRKKINSLNIGIASDREEIKKRITLRLQKRLNEGMIEEVEELITSGISHSKLKFFGLEYKYISLYIEKKINYEQMFEELNRSIHRFAKRQMTWFRKMEKEGVKINWFDTKDYVNIKNFVEGKLGYNANLSRNR